jgi:hypothetical protein
MSSLVKTAIAETAVEVTSDRNQQPEEVRQMRTFLSIFLVGVLAGTATVALAKKPGPIESHPGGLSAGHMSDKGAANTNGPTSADRDHGQDRAMDRRSEQGFQHFNAADAHQNNTARKGKGHN